MSENMKELPSELSTSSYCPFPNKSTSMFFIWAHSTNQRIGSLQTLWKILQDSEFKVEDLPPTDQKLRSYSKYFPIAEPIPCQVSKSAKDPRCFWLNSLADICSKAIGNPTLVSKIQTIPEFSATYSEYFHGNKWREMEPFKTPMVVTNKGDSIWVNTFIFNKTLKMVGKVKEIYKKGKEIMMKVFRVYTPSDLPNSRIEILDCEVILSSNEAEWNVTDDLYNIKVLHWQDAMVYPKLYCRYQLLNNSIEPISADALSITNRWKERSNGKRIITLPIVSYYDDFGKSWGGLHCQLAGLCQKERNLEENIHLVSLVPPGITSLEVMRHHVQDIQVLERGVTMWHAGFKEEVFVIGGLYCLIADMPQANIFCNCKKPHADYACRHCTIHRDQQGQFEIPTIYSDQQGQIEMPTIHSDQQGQDEMSTMHSDEQEQSEMPTIHSDQQGQNEIPTARTKKTTLQFLQKVKDGTMKEKEGKGLKNVENPLLELNHFDPHKDIPVELLHAWYLGVVKKSLLFTIHFMISVTDPKQENKFLKTLEIIDLIN